MATAQENILKRPIITEKSTNLASSLQQYTFEVPKDATKTQIKEAFAELFPNHEVKKVNTSRIFGHSKRTKKGVRSPRDSKKAIITVEGDHIDYFPEV